jgi:GntR family transcriptional regulator
MFEPDLKSRKSIYEQVANNLKEEILTGVIRADEKLPSVREISKSLTINPNTVQKAFRELERQGYIYTVAGLGAFARAREDIKPDERMIAETRAKLSEDIRELYFLILDKAALKMEIERMVETLFRDEATSVINCDGVSRSAEAAGEDVLLRREEGNSDD